MDSPRSYNIREVLHQKRRLVVRHSLNGAFHIREDSVPGIARQGRHRQNRDRLPDAEADRRVPAGRHIRADAAVLGRGA